MPAPAAALACSYWLSPSLRARWGVCVSRGIAFVRDLLHETLSCLSNFRRDDLLPDMATEELRAAIHAIGRITGRVDVEEVLDVLFREFCIGK